MKQHELKAYASSFASFLLKNIGDKSGHIDAIILYGSAASGTATKQSDVDLFIDTKADVSEELNKILREFYESREAAIFKLRGIENEISMKAGELRKWKELHRSIASNGIFLWGRYEAKELPVGTEHSVIFYWSGVGKGRSAFLNKLYGFRSKGKKYDGVLNEWGGMRLGRSCILIPAKRKEEMFWLVKKYGVNAKMLEAYVLK